MTKDKGTQELTECTTTISLGRRLTGGEQTAGHTRLGTGHIFQVLSVSPRDKKLVKGH